MEELYLIEILHQTTTRLRLITTRYLLYLIEILHQTTTVAYEPCFNECCILSKFYIKPQRVASVKTVCVVVSYRNSTSNHNRKARINERDTVVSYRNSTSNHNEGYEEMRDVLLYLIEILHQTTTRHVVVARSPGLYLIEILHQTTTRI